MRYLQQSVLHLHRDRDSELKAMLRTTTQIVAGGVQLVSAVWKQDVGQGIHAIFNIATAIRDAADSRLKRW